MSTEPAVDVVVPLFNEASTIGNLCEALSKQSARRFRIILVDNGSTDATVSMAAKYFDVFTCDVPGSYAARNYGASLGKAPYIAFTDGDCIPSPNWLEELCVALDAGADVVAGITRACSRGKLSTSGLGRSLLTYRVEYYGGATIYIDPDGPRCSFPSCNVAYRRTVFEGLGRFTNDIGSDVALSSRAIQSGYTCRIISSAELRHCAASDVTEILRKFFLYSQDRKLSTTELIAALLFLLFFPITLPSYFLSVFCRRRYRAKRAGIALWHFALFESLRLAATVAGLVWFRFSSPSRIY